MALGNVARGWGGAEVEVGMEAWLPALVVPWEYYRHRVGDDVAGGKGLGTAS